MALHRRHLQRNPDNQLYPLFEYFENWCQVSSCGTCLERRACRSAQLTAQHLRTPQDISHARHVLVHMSVSNSEIEKLARTTFRSLTLALMS